MKEFIEDAEKRIVLGVNEKIEKHQAFLKIKAPNMESTKEIQYSGKKSDNEIFCLLEKFDDKWKNVIYCIFAKELPDGYENRENAKKKFDAMNKKCKTKSGKNSNCMPKVNEDEHWNLSANKTKHGYCIYVGKCKDKTKTRMTHHMEKVTKKNTFGLHLGEWWDKPLKIFVLVFGDEIAEEYLQPIEDILWDSYKPLFGKKGSR